MHGFYPAIPRDLIEIEDNKEDEKAESDETSPEKSEETKLRQLYAENSGIAIIFPSWRLLEIFDDKTFKDRMAKLFEEEKDPLIK